MEAPVVTTEEPTFGQKIADQLTLRIGSWSFLIWQNVFFLVWMTLNCVAWFWHWDPYPFILMNLALSFQAAETGPVLLISANRADSNRAKIMEQIELHTRLIERHTEQMDEHAKETHAMIGEVRRDHRRMMVHLGLIEDAIEDGGEDSIHSVKLSLPPQQEVVANQSQEGGEDSKRDAETRSKRGGLHRNRKRQS